MLYILPTPPELKGKLLGLGRLYSRPSEPEPLDGAELCILDNGAWGMHARGGEWTERSLRDLESYYLQYGGDDRPPWAGVMPDVYLDPQRTIQLARWWLKNVGRKLGPVIQFSGKKNLDLYPVASQIRAYRELEPGIIFISNPGLTGWEAMDARFLSVVHECRQSFPGAWLHVLGAGWSTVDIKYWSLTGVDSIDSVQYYLCAKRGVAWSGLGKADWTDRAVCNGIAGGLVACGAIEGSGGDRNEE